MSDDAINRIFDQMFSGYSVDGDIHPGFEIKVDEWLRNMGISTAVVALQSKEYLALVSIAYNNPSIIDNSNSLALALRHENRAEAWFEIRYRTNLDKNQGIANRRYHESDLFGLYDNENAATLDEAESVYRMVTRHIETMKTYETDFPPAGVDARTGTLQQNLAPAYAALMERYAAESAILVEWDKIQIGKDDSTTWADGDDTVDQLNGTDRNDLLVGRSGDDTLTGGLGRDILVGGDGRDVLHGVDGADHVDGGANGDTLNVRGEVWFLGWRRGLHHPTVAPAYSRLGRCLEKQLGRKLLFDENGPLLRALYAFRKSTLMHGMGIATST